MRNFLSLAAVVAAIFVTCSSGAYAGRICDGLLVAYEVGLTNKAYARGANGRGCGYSTGRLRLEDAKSQAIAYCEVQPGVRGCHIVYSQGQVASGTRIQEVSAPGRFKRQ
jgi:hypothetical protein